MCLCVFKQKTAYEMRISDWSSDVCSSDLDHPLGYGDFEGVIPQGQYGGGTVMLWDRGTWRALGDPHEGYAEGKLKFELDGARMKGAWMLVRMGGKAAPEKRDNWLLIKERDAEVGRAHVRTPVTNAQIV